MILMLLFVFFMSFIYKTAIVQPYSNDESNKIFIIEEDVSVQYGNITFLVVNKFFFLRTESIILR